MEQQTFTILGRAYSMRDPKTFGAEVRIQQTRKAYFNRTEPIGETEMRSSVRQRFNDWAESIEDTYLEDIIIVCAMLEPIGDSPYLIPENLLAAQPWQIKEEVKEATNFFMSERDRSWKEYLVSKLPSETTTEVPTQMEESSIPESTSL